MGRGIITFRTHKRKLDNRNQVNNIIQCQTKAELIQFLHVTEFRTIILMLVMVVEVFTAWTVMSVKTHKETLI